ncbi:hypothetical protein [Paludibacterium purpuratum]|uniref:Uncharacterized protein n=1 Tax=Paludibacterium purpuratum TaxID=1144873 RepID=A0A4R7B0I8_9NEIS|nr:hypothetical protein [Paludibacterium purpuratum]TDR76426.1 hypothetical protein DFP86_1119 [Paludibacterium purpuratum]
MNTINKKLSFIAILRESYDFIWRERGNFSWPFAILIGVLLLQPIYIALHLHWATASSSSVVVLMGVLAFLADLAFSIGIVRATAHGEFRPGWRFFRVDRLLWQCLWVQVLVVLLSGALLMAITIPLSFVIMTFINLRHWFIAAGLVASLVLVYAWIRTRLVLAVPLRALGVARPIAEAWALARGNVWRILGLILLAWVPMLVLSVISVLPLWGLAGKSSFAIYSVWPLMVYVVCYGVCGLISYVVQANCCRALRTVSVPLP